MARCPQCGENVSQFAPGCAICGADLEAARRALPPERATGHRRQMPDVLAPLRGIGDGIRWVGICLLVTLAVPLFGFILGVVGLNNTAIDHDRHARPALLVVTGVALVMTILPGTRLGLFGYV